MKKKRKTNYENIKRIILSMDNNLMKCHQDTYPLTINTLNNKSKRKKRNINIQVEKCREIRIQGITKKLFSVYHSFLKQDFCPRRNLRNGVSREGHSSSTRHAVNPPYFQEVSLSLLQEITLTAISNTVAVIRVTWGDIGEHDLDEILERSSRVLSFFVHGTRGRS